MARLYACIISPDVRRDRDELLSIAGQFSYSIEVLEDGILFDVRGLERLIGKPDKIAVSIIDRLKSAGVAGNVAVAETIESAMLLARQKREADHAIASPNEFQKLPLRDLGFERDTVGIFNELGITSIEELRQIPERDLINRYGREFQRLIDVIHEKGRALLKPNVKEDRLSWKYDLDHGVEDFEQLIFIINHGLEALFAEVGYNGFSTEHLDLTFGLTNGTRKSYEIKCSFPTLQRAFWLKLINLRVPLDAPEAAIKSIEVTANFTRSRADQKGLYAVSRPEPESLLLTVNKLRNLVGEANVGVPVLLNQRVALPFAIDVDKVPEGSEAEDVETAAEPVIAFTYFKPPLRAEVLVRDGRLVFLKTRMFSGHVTEYSGVWRANSKWWDRSWKTQEWDVEVESHGVYRLCKVDKEWFLAGEYD